MNRVRQPRVLRHVLNRLPPARLVCEQVIGHRPVRELFDVGVVCIRGGHRHCDETILHVRHPQIAALATVVDQPDCAHAALCFLNHRLRQRTEEADEIRFAYEQIERMVDDVGLHLGDALGARGVRRFTNECRAQHLRIVRVHL